MLVKVIGLIGEAGHWVTVFSFPKTACLTFPAA